MKKCMKLLSVVFIGLLILTGCNKKEVVIPKKDEISKEILKSQKVEVFEFTNINLVYENKMSNFEVNVTNTSDNVEELKEFTIIFKDAKKNEIISLVGYVGSTIEPHETKTIIANCSEDLTKAKSVEYLIVR